MRFSGGNRSPQTFSAHFLRKSAATKLFRLISSGNRLPQNFFGSFPQEIARHKTFSAYFPIKQENGGLSVCQGVNTDCSTHPKGTNKKRARCACFRYFAVVIRHLISRPQRTPKSSRNVTAKVWEPAKAPQRLRRLIPR